MMHPYATAPAHQRWRTAMTRTAPADIDPVIGSPWRLTQDDRIATAGSCFAQHVARRLRDNGLGLLDAEPAHSILSAQVAEDFGFGLYSARFGSIYTSRQLLQLLRRAYGRFTPAEDVWEGERGLLFDPFRPTIQPNGYPTREEYDADRRAHFAAVRSMFETATVFIFTLGLTECWRAKADGAVYPLCPGVAAGTFDPERHEFHNLSAAEVIADLDAFLTEVREINPELRVILTVSPVALAATAEPRHVWTSTTASKAALRVAAEEIAQRPGVLYFPSYEVITNPASRGAYYQDDLREVTAEGVDHVMRLFFQHMVEGGVAEAAPSSPAQADAFLEQAARAVAVLCDESKLDPVEAVSPGAAPAASTTGGVSDLARSRAAAGRYREAVDLMATQPGEMVDPDTLRDLVLWRNAAFDPQPGAPNWPQRYADPFPGASAPPEIHVKDLTAEILGGAIQNHGCLIVRGLTDPSQTEQLSRVVRGAFKSAAAIQSGEKETDPEAWYSPYPLQPGDGLTEGGRSFGTLGGAVWTADSPRAFADFVAFLKVHGVTKIIEDYLGERAYLSLGKSTLRIVPPDSGTAWHQDGAFLGPDIRTVNVWLALSDCGVDAPSLDVYPKRMNELAEMGTRGAFVWWTVGDGVVEDLRGDTPILTPTFKAGDAMLFDQLFLHRTGVHPGMTKERMAIESWFFAGSTFPMAQMPLAI
jgi:hypothetical protein